MDLTDDDVREILKLFAQSKFDFLQLEHGERRIIVSKRGSVRVTSNTKLVPERPVAPAATASPAATPQAAEAENAAVEEGLVAVKAPMVGKFYAAPSPTDPAFVEKGARVAEGATLGLIEVMKVFTSIKSEMAGVIERISVCNGQFVEYGQTLFLIRPDQPAGRTSAA